MVSYIIPYKDRFYSLLSCVSSIQAQTQDDIEIFIVDVSGNHRLYNSRLHIDFIKTFWRTSFLKYEGEYPNCYSVSNWVLDQQIPKGDWLCFPNDDSYYVPVWQERMLDTANQFGLDFVYCDIVLDKINYRVLDTKPAPCQIDKTSFIVRRDKFPGFQVEDRKGYWDGGIADGHTAELMVRQGLRHGKADGILCVHN